MCCGVYGKRLRRERYLFLSFVRVLRCVALVVVAVVVV